MKYTINYFREFFQSKDNWCEGTPLDKDGNSCAVGHFGVRYREKIKICSPTLTVKELIEMGGNRRALSALGKIFAPIFKNKPKIKCFDRIFVINDGNWRDNVSYQDFFNDKNTSDNWELIGPKERLLIALDYCEKVYRDLGVLDIIGVPTKVEDKVVVEKEVLCMT